MYIFTVFIFRFTFDNDNNLCGARHSIICFMLCLQVKETQICLVSYLYNVLIILCMGRVLLLKSFLIIDTLNMFPMMSIV